MQYGFRFSRTTADVLTAISEWVYQALYKNDESGAIVLDMLELFDRVCHIGLLSW